MQTLRAQLRRSILQHNLDVSKVLAYEPTSFQRRMAIVQVIMLVILSSVYIFIALVISNCRRCSLNSIDPMVLSPLPEILYYYQTWCFLGFRGANYNDWIRIQVNYHTA